MSTPIPQPVAPTPRPFILAGPKVLTMGPSGTGKTHAIGTLVETGIEVFYFDFENGKESLIGYFLDKGKPIPENLHISTVHGPSASFLEMADAARSVNTLSYEMLLKQADNNRSRYDQFEKFLRSFNDVTDDNGIKYGPIDKFKPNQAIVIDGLTGMCAAARATVIGGKFVIGQNEWGTSQNMIEFMLRKMCSELKCMMVVIAHVERETDPNGGGLKLMASALGKALAPKLPIMFSDVVLAKRLGNEFYWDTKEVTADLKTRNLPISEKLPPDFKLIVEKWKSRGGVI